MHLEIFTFTNESGELIEVVEAERYQDAVKKAKDPRIADKNFITKYTSSPLRRKFAITMEQNINSFCPYCGKFLWEELGCGSWFDCKQCKREISNKRYMIVSVSHIQDLEKKYKQKQG